MLATASTLLLALTLLFLFYVPLPIDILRLQWLETLSLKSFAWFPVYTDSVLTSVKSFGQIPQDVASAEYSSFLVDWNRLLAPLESQTPSCARNSTISGLRIRGFDSTGACSTTDTSIPLAFGVNQTLICRLSFSTTSACAKRQSEIRDFFLFALESPQRQICTSTTDTCSNATGNATLCGDLVINEPANPSPLAGNASSCPTVLTKSLRIALLDGRLVRGAIYRDENSSSSSSSQLDMDMTSTLLTLRLEFIPFSVPDDTPRFYHRRGRLYCPSETRCLWELIYPLLMLLDESVPSILELAELLASVFATILVLVIARRRLTGSRRLIVH